MGIEINADEVFEMAEQIERGASTFYRQAAHAAPDPACRKVLLYLASMEADHEQVFASIKAHPDGFGPAEDRRDTQRGARPHPDAHQPPGVADGHARRRSGAVEAGPPAHVAGASRPGDLRRPATLRSARPRAPARPDRTA
jgi:hypothetical protein